MTRDPHKQGCEGRDQGAESDKDRLIVSLRATLAKMEVALGALDESIVFADDYGRVEWCNAPFCDLVAKSRIEILGAHLVDLLPFRRSGRQVAPGEHPVARVLFERREVNSVHEFQRTGEPPRLIRLIGQYVNHNANRGQGVFVVRDVTIEKRELQRDRLAVLGSLTRGMIHQINSPMGALRSNIEYLQEGVAGESLDRSTQLSVLDESLESLDHVMSVLGSVGRFGGPETDRFQLFDLADSIESAARLAKGDWDTVAQVQIPPARGDVDVYGDPSSVTQAVVQLLSNAAWSVSQRGALHRRTNSVFKGRITVTMRPIPDWVILEIIDNGIGVPVAQREQIFEPFFSAWSGKNSAGQGLFVARTIIEDLHGGSLSLAESKEGARFVVRLPSFARE